MPSRFVRAARWKLSYMSAQPVAVFGAGADPPPDSSDPRPYAAMSAVVVTAPRSAWVIWPIFSSRVIRPSRSVTRTGTGWVGSWYGAPAAFATPAGTATVATSTDSVASSRPAARSSGRDAGLVRVLAITAATLREPDPNRVS